MPMESSPKHCLMVVENLAVPFDRRSWQSALALRAAGWEVTVICPRSRLHPLRREVIEGITILRHALPVEGRGLFGLALEYVVALLAQLGLSAMLYLRKPFQVIQVCNPPDMMFLVALMFRPLGVRFVFDQHDLCPELYAAKFGRRDAGWHLSRWLERCSFGLADHVIVANDNFAALAGRRNGKPVHAITTMRSVPPAAQFANARPDPALRNSKRLLIGYVGIIAIQDGLDYLVRALALLRDRHGESDLHCCIVGDGPDLPRIRALAAELSVQDMITFTGYLSGEAFRTHLASFDIGVVPDPPNAYTHNITMNKVFEYMALGIPMAGFELSETQRLTGPAAAFAWSATAEGLAEAMLPLIRDDALRARMGEAGRRRMRGWSWNQEAARLVDVYQRLARPAPGLPAPRPISAAATPAPRP